MPAETFRQTANARGVSESTDGGCSAACGLARTQEGQKAHPRTDRHHRCQTLAANAQRATRQQAHEPKPAVQQAQASTQTWLKLAEPVKSTGLRFCRQLVSCREDTRHNRREESSEVGNEGGRTARPTPLLRMNESMICAGATAAAPMSTTNSLATQSKPKPAATRNARRAAMQGGNGPACRSGAGCSSPASGKWCNAPRLRTANHNTRRRQHRT